MSDDIKRLSEYTDKELFAEADRLWLIVNQPHNRQPQQMLNLTKILVLLLAYTTRW